jgi:FixJ family two-component response regulator
MQYALDLGVAERSHRTVESNVTNQCTLPSHKSDAQRNTQLQQPPLISIVDDDQSVREAITSLVRSLGYDVVTFCSADDFLESGHVKVTACLITDVQMPGLSGVELYDRLIADGHRVPVIFVTAFPDERVRGRLLNDGAVGYLDKPFSEDRLIEHLNVALGNNGLTGSVR